MQYHQPNRLVVFFQAMGSKFQDGCLISTKTNQYSSTFLRRICFSGRQMHSNPNYVVPLATIYLSAVGHRKRLPQSSEAAKADDKLSLILFFLFPFRFDFFAHSLMLMSVVLGC
ncbi:hypothetical protein GQ457_09G015660 [Hibiscus cannabinus]